MKGVILDCLEKLVLHKRDKKTWKTILERAGLDPNASFLVNQDIDDEIVMRIVQATCAVLDRTLQQTAGAFGIYWMKYYAPSMYRAYFGDVPSAREFLLQMNDVHERVTKNIRNARPPRFEYEQPDDKTLLMTYRSDRDLMDFFIGLVNGVGHHFNEELTILRAGDHTLKIIFP